MGIYPMAISSNSFAFTSVIDSPAYPHPENTRDLRIDFLRGLIMVYVILVHFEYFSALSMFAWDRLGIISSAEGFVFLSGTVVGMVYKKRLEKSGLKTTSMLLWKRAFTLYRVNIYMIISIALLGLVPNVNLFEVTHWTNPWSKESFPLFPPEGASVVTYLWQALLLRIGPHQYQIIGLYVVLLTAAPAALYLLARGKIGVLLIISWSLYLFNHFLHLKITGARYEMGFPTLTWQLIFFHGMAVGYYRHVVLSYIASATNSRLFYFSLIFISAFFILAQNNQNPMFWPWGHLSLLDPETYKALHSDWFQKTTLGLGRIANNTVLFIAGYYLLTQYWKWLESALGWLFIPLGQNSLYVFTLHVYFIILVINTPLPGFDHFIVNTFLHLSVIFSIWWMVKHKILFNVIPR